MRNGGGEIEVSVEESLISDYEVGMEKEERNPCVWVRGCNFYVGFTQQRPRFPTPPLRESSFGALASLLFF